MLNKPADVPYCGVDKEIIVSANPILDADVLKTLFEFIQERYLVHIKKDVENLPKPWTTFKPLLEYKFTNVKRYHDRESINLINNIAKNDSLTLEDKITNILLFRAWNKWKTIHYLGGPWKGTQLTESHFIQDMEDRVAFTKKFNPKYVWFCNCFNTGSMKKCWGPLGATRRIKAYEGSPKKSDQFGLENHSMPVRVFGIVPFLEENKTVERILASKSQKEVFDIVGEIPGFADFLSYQVFVDFSYIPEFLFSENEFTIAGPGCKRGLDRLFIYYDEMSYDEALFWFRDHAEELAAKNNVSLKDLMNDLPDYDRQFTVMDAENIFCELSKLMKLVQGTGRPKVKYAGIPSRSESLF